MHLLILGCGDIGTRVGLSLIQQGWRVSAVRRQPHLLPDCFERLGLDITDEDLERPWALRPRARRRKYLRWAWQLGHE